jgi:hypothetical protein
MRRDVQQMPKSREKTTRKKNTRCHDKSIKMQRCVYGREGEASLKLIEILTGYAITRSANGKTALVWTYE